MGQDLFGWTHGTTRNPCALSSREAVAHALDDMHRVCGGGDIPARLVRTTARSLRLSTVEFAEAAARLNRPFCTNHVR